MADFWKLVVAVSLSIVFVYLCITLVDLWAEKRRHDQAERDIRAVQFEIQRNLNRRIK